MIKKIKHPTHQVYRKMPTNLESQDKHLFEHEKNKQIPESYLLTVSNALIFNIFIFKIPLFKSYNQYSRGVITSKKILLTNIISAKIGALHIPSALWIIDEWSVNYFHWFLDALPRLLLISEPNLPILLPRKFEQISFITESLKKFPNKIIFYEQNQLIRVKKLIIASYTAPSGNYSQFLFSELRQKFTLNIQKSPLRTVYISRQNANRRKITNETAIQKLLQKYNVEIHFFEDYNFEKQQQIMSETKVLIGLHGAGLTNMLFMPKGGKVLELRNQNDASNNCYFSLASMLNFDYFYQVCKGDSTNTNLATITVNLVKLEQNLKQLMESQ